MAKVTINAETQDTLGFLAEPIGSRDTLTSGGRIDASAISANAAGRKEVSAGTVVGKNRNETLYGPVAFTADTSVDDEEVYLTAGVVLDADSNADVELLRHGRAVYYNRLPGWDSLDAAVQAWIHANYHTMKAVE